MRHKTLVTEGNPILSSKSGVMFNDMLGNTLSIKSADAIFRRVEALLGEVTAERLLAADFDELRACGLSGHKVEYLRGIMMLNHLDDLTEADFKIYRKRYSPFGTLASLYLWRIKDGGLRIADLETTASVGY